MIGQPTNRDHCPVCASHDLAEILHIPSAPVGVGVWPTREAALGAPLGSIRVTLCRGCGFIFNSAFADDLTYAAGSGYDCSLHHSSTYQSYLEAEAGLLIERYNIRQRSVVEVGCGTGHFLRLICGLGQNTGYGFDPRLQQPGTERVNEQDITLIADLYGPDYADIRADLVVTRSVMEVVAEPRDFLWSIRNAIGSRSDTVLYIEVPNASWVFGSQKVWNVYYEHCSYFTLDLLPRLLAACGFATVACEPCYDDGQHLRVEARPVEAPSLTFRNATPELEESMRSYSRRYSEVVSEWRARLQTLRTQAKRVVVWGAGGRGTAFLNTVSPDPLTHVDPIDFAVDVNPDRQGSFVSGSGHRILPLSALLDNPADVVIITNATYEDEIRVDAGRMGLNCQFLVV